MGLLLVPVPEPVGFPVPEPDADVEEAPEDVWEPDGVEDVELPAVSI